MYLHSGIVQTRNYGDSLSEKREALKFATIDSHTRSPSFRPLELRSGMEKAARPSC